MLRLMSTILPNKIEVPLPGGVKMPFRLIVDRGEEAEFGMGSRGYFPDEEPVHKVRLVKPYYMGVTPVTQLQYQAMAQQCEAKLKQLVGNKGPSPSKFKGENNPVEQVDWEDAELVCNWLTASNILQEGWHAGLPSEAEWEYACRSGSYREYCSGDGEAVMRQLGWFEGNSTSPMPVGQFAANNFGLCDMHGNVREWCADVWDANAYRKRSNGWQAKVWTDGSDPTIRVLRGGSWFRAATFCRSACRYWRWSGRRLGFFGFRICLRPPS